MLLLASTVAAVAADPAGSGWVKSMNAETRLIGGARPLPDGTVRPLAGVEIKLADGWKTYWRHPGDAGGIAPGFDWTGSENLAAARVLFPAPERMVDSTGTTIGYKKGVVLPIAIEPKDPSRPVSLRLAIEYGICREICVPAEAKLSVVIAVADVPGLPPQLAGALGRVPREVADRRTGDPRLKAATAALGGVRPHLRFDVSGDSAGADLFVEAPDGIMLAMTRKVGAPEPGVQRYEAEIHTAEDARALAGKTLTLTMVSAKGSSQERWVVK